MSAIGASEKLLSALKAARPFHSWRVRELNALARGDEQLTPAQRDELADLTKLINAQLEAMTDGVRTQSRVVPLDTHREEVPKALSEAYELLHVRTYGGGGISIGDEALIHGLGKADTRTTSGGTTHRGGAHPGKKLGSSRRNVVKDAEAFAFKRKIDKRLRKIAKEVQSFLHGDEMGYVLMRCEKCHRIGEDDWKYCARCGGVMAEDVSDQ